MPGVTDNAGQPLAANPFLDVRVRRALNMAIACEAIAERVMEGQAGATTQWLPPGVFSHTPDVRVQPQDTDGARRLLAEAGFPQGLSVTLTTPNDRFPNDSRIAQAWRKAGPALACRPRWMLSPGQASRGAARARNSRCA